MRSLPLRRRPPRRPTRPSGLSCVGDRDGACGRRATDGNMRRPPAVVLLCLARYFACGCLSALLFAGVLASVARAEIRIALLPDRAVQQAGGAQADASPPWLDVDYGPAVSTTLEIVPGHVAPKAIAVRVDPGAGGFARGRDYLAFDTDALRCVAGWRGRGGIDYRGLAFDGQLEGEPEVVGSLLFLNPDIAGWSRADGSAWNETRYVGRDGRRYGPLNSSQGRWLGHYQKGDQVVWSYEVYGTAVREWPDALADGDTPILARHFEIGARSEPLLLQVAYDATGAIEVFGEGPATEQTVLFAAPGRAAGRVARRGDRLSRREPVEEHQEEDEESYEEEADEEESYEDDQDQDEDEDEYAGDEFEHDPDLASLEYEGETSLLVRDKQAFDLTDADYSIVARIRTEEGGTIFAQAPQTGGYAENSKSFFVSEGVLQYDVGWVGAVRSKVEVDDGRWHRVAMVYDASTGEVRLYVDGDESGSGELAPTEAVDREQVLRIGFTSPDFPDFVRGFEGDIERLAFYQRQLSEAEIRAWGAEELPTDQLIASWTEFDHDADELVDETGQGHDAVLEDVDLEENAFEEEQEDPRERRLRFDGESVRLAVGNLPVDEATASSYTIAARIRTEEGGPIFAVAGADESWQPNNVCWFVRDGVLVFDMGFVGQVEGTTDVADGQWHDVAMSYERETGSVRFLVDGKVEPLAIDSEDEALFPLDREEDVEQGDTAWIGYASKDFPEEAPRYLSGMIEQLRIYEDVLDAEEVARLMAMPADESLGVVAAWMPALAEEGVVEDESGNEFDAVVQGERTEASTAQEETFEATACGVLGTPSGTRWVTTSDGHLRLEIPPGDAPLRFTVWYGGLPERDAWGSLPEFQPASLLASQAEPGPQPGEPVVVEPVVMDVPAADSEEDAFVVDKIPVPVENAYGSRLRFCGLDFFPGGKSAALSTLAGEVWIVSGLGQEELSSVTWRRIATGLYQPLGLKIVDGQIYVTCRGQIVRLRDKNGDDVVDYYESFNDDAQVTAHYGEFAVDLETDDQGNFYYAKGARRGLPPVVPQHGTVLRVAADGSSTEIVATGFRAPAGLATINGGLLYATDLAGRWTPTSKINLVRQGQFYGNHYAFNLQESASHYVQPITWIDDAVDPGPSDVVVVRSDRWGHLEGQLLCLSNASGSLYVLLRQAEARTAQGALYRLPLAELPGASCRGRFNLADGQLYVCGMGPPEGPSDAPGGFYRVRATERAAALPTAVRPNNEGISITFSVPLDRETATDWRSYAAARWSYRRTAQYGSDRYRISDPRRRGRDRLRIERVELSDDQRTVHVKLNSMPPADQIRLQLSVKSQGGDPVAHTVYFTYHTPGKAVSE